MEYSMKAVLFDLDGVVVDTEPQYSRFWHHIGVERLGMNDLEMRIKGQTLAHIYESFFPGQPDVQADITARLDRFEEDMDYEYVPGVMAFVNDLRRHHVYTAIVTSSNKKKMEALYRARPELPASFDRVLTAEMFAASKPDPACFLLGMEMFQTDADHTWVCEDSFNGLRAGRASGATVIGLATTNTREAITPFCDHVLDDFRGFTYKDMLQISHGNANL